jgi:hypothetical protein
LRTVTAAGNDGGSDAQLRSLLQETQADGVVLPLTVDEFPAARASFGETVVFSPTVGLTDEEVDRRWHRVAELAA